MPYTQASVTGQLPATNSENFFDNIGLGVGLIGLALLLAAALVAAFGMLPRQPGTEAVVAGLSVAGFVSLVFLLLGLVDTVEAGVGLILALVSSVLQAGWPSDPCCRRRASSSRPRRPPPGTPINARSHCRSPSRSRRRPTRLPPVRCPRTGRRHPLPAQPPKPRRTPRISNAHDTRRWHAHIFA
jgi:hypothetical protein